MNISYRIRAIDNFSKTHDKLNKQLVRIKRSFEGLSEMESVKIEANTKEFKKDVAQAEHKVESFPKRVKVHVSANYKEFRQKVDRMADSMRDFGELSQRVGIGGIFMALPALVPILGSAIGGMGALGSALMSAGVGAAGFGAVAIPIFTDLAKKNEALAKAQEKVNEASDSKEKAKALKELKAVQDSLTGSQRKSIDAMKDFNSFFKKFTKQFETPILDIFNQSLGILKTTLKSLKPAIDGMVVAVGNIFDAFERTLKTDEMKAFFDWVGTTAGPHFEKLVLTVGNFLMGFTNMMIAFNPLAQSFMDGFLNMSEKFREWSTTLSESTAFQDFISYVRENGPTVLSLIGNIVTTLWNLGVAMAPLGEAILNLLNSFFAWTSELFKNHKWTGMLVGVVSVLMGAFLALWPVVIVLKSVFGTLWPVLTTGVRWIKNVWNWLSKLSQIIVAKVLPKLGGLTKGIGKVIPWILRIGSKLKWVVGGPFGLIIGIVIELTILIVKNWDTIWSKTKEVFSAIGTFIETKWEQIKTAFAVVAIIVKTVIDKFADMRQAVMDKMNAIWDKITEIWDEVMSFFEGIDLFEIGANIIEGLMNGIASMGKKLVDSVKGVVDDAIQGAKNLLGIKSPSRVFKQFGVFTGEGFIIGMDRMNQGVATAGERMAQSAIPDVPKSPSYAGMAVADTRREYENSRRSNRDRQRTPNNDRQSLTQNLHFYGDAAKTPRDTARKNKQALRNWGMEADFN